ncbi:PTS glucose transporter subunit IIA [Schaalia sp. ZJ405]|uniref:PTS sugar transporter subunit IIA n=1 Tax=Schaalia sp. ZJ405 TaxID=2709403 RepID=UPI0013EA8A53|nr:PTS glucose transporter subunit IIA [Schaalia sp. ZJ405]QPK80572.1 PTS glucose transporter subunit IIA [Schaalia sp. ZJ405]
MSIEIACPVSGEVTDLSSVSDPVFAQGIVGPGTAIYPARGGTVVRALAPLGGRVVTMHPHAFVVESPDGVRVLVHLGIDTVKLRGEGFTPLVSVGDEVRVGDILIRWDITAARDAELDLVVPVIVLDIGDREVTPLVWPGTPALEGGPLLRLS